jgi:hypothetical protein
MGELTSIFSNGNVDKLVLVSDTFDTRDDRSLLEVTELESAQIVVRDIRISDLQFRNRTLREEFHLPDP